MGYEEMVLKKIELEDKATKGNMTEKDLDIYSLICVCLGIGLSPIVEALISKM